MDGAQYRMPISYTAEQEIDKNNNNNNYPYGNLEMNLIRPESERPRQHETNPEGSTHYTVSNNESPELEEAETAEEYVAKAMHIYGTRLREPIRITAESLAPDTPTVAQSTVGGSSSSRGGGGTGSHRNSASAAGNGVKSFDVFELVERHQQQQQQQQQMQEEQQAKAQAAAAEAAAQAQALAQAQAIAEAQAEAQVQAEIQAHMQQQQQQQQQQMESQTERIQMASPQPAPVYEKDPVTRSYDIFDYSSYTPAAERHYQPKYQQSSTTGFLRSENEEKIRVSASTEIPKAEIMKQIEKSVMKYMKELEAEGKIVAAAANTEETKVYYKSQPGEAKRMAGSTGKPKSQHNGGGTSYSNIEYNGRESASTSPSTMVRHHMPKQSSKPAMSQFQETETAYQAPQDIADAMAPNIEFVYKIKTRAPLQSAAVKTVSKPYSLQLKGGAGGSGGSSSSTIEQFDHSAALKAMEDFDLSHAITNEDEAQQSQTQSQRYNAIGKPSKLYFNSETYHDINSLPYKTEKSRQSQNPEYRNAIKSDLLHPDYKGYSGFFVQSDSLEFEKGGESSPSSDDGYPIMNPYKYVFKKEALGNSKYEEAPEHQLPQRNKHHPSQYYSGQKAIAAAAAASTDFDSYNPKFNNNPEGYGYQHSAYKGHLASSSSSAENSFNHKFQSRHPGSSGGSGGKRGKRGGSNNPAHPVNNKKSARNAPSKDIEADIALRPPPKA